MTGPKLDVVVVGAGGAGLPAASTLVRAGLRVLCLEAAYFHDWHADPFARGCCSYVPAGALPARRALAEPVAGTLYFADEATDLEGHSATVHGAIASGHRAARQVLQDIARG